MTESPLLIVFDNTGFPEVFGKCSVGLVCDAGLLLCPSSFFKNKVGM